MGRACCLDPRVRGTKLSIPNPPGLVCQLGKQNPSTLTLLTPTLTHPSTPSLRAGITHTHTWTEHPLDRPRRVIQPCPAQPHPSHRTQQTSQPAVEQPLHPPEQPPAKREGREELTQNPPCSRHLLPTSGPHPHMCTPHTCALQTQTLRNVKHEDGSAEHTSAAPTLAFQAACAAA